VRRKFIFLEEDVDRDLQEERRHRRLLAAIVYID
jgi:hypothetical protein